MGLYEELLNNYDAKLIAGGAAQNTARGAQVSIHKLPPPPPRVSHSFLSIKNPNSERSDPAHLPNPFFFVSRQKQYILPPSSVLFIGCVGSDKYADILREASTKAGLRVEYRLDPSTPTGRCGVVLTDHNRSMCTHLAAANEYKIEHLKSPEIWPLVEQASVYFVGGYHLTVCPPAILALAKEAAAKDKIFILSLSAPFIPVFFKDQLDQTAPYWDYVIGNETEARSYADSHDLGTQDVKKIARALAELPKVNGRRKRTVVITQGTGPTVVAVQGEKEEREYPVHEIEKEKINDTNGAGWVSLLSPL